MPESPPPPPTAPVAPQMPPHLLPPPTANPQLPPDREPHLLARAARPERHRGGGRHREHSQPPHSLHQSRHEARQRPREIRVPEGIFVDAEHLQKCDEQSIVSLSVAVAGRRVSE